MNRRDATNVLVRAGMTLERIDAFLAWHSLHPQVWREFEAAGLEHMRHGGRLSSKAIFEEIRQKVGTHDAHRPALNNNYHAAFARLFAAKHNCESRFEFRRLGGFETPAAETPIPTHWSEGREG